MHAHYGILCMLFHPFLSLSLALVHFMFSASVNSHWTLQTVSTYMKTDVCRCDAAWNQTHRVRLWLLFLFMYSSLKFLVKARKEGRFFSKLLKRVDYSVGARSKKTQITEGIFFQPSRIIFSLILSCKFDTEWMHNRNFSASESKAREMNKK